MENKHINFILDCKQLNFRFESKQVAGTYVVPWTELLMQFAGMCWQNLASEHLSTAFAQMVTDDT